MTLGGNNLTTAQKTDEQTANTQVWIGYYVISSTGTLTLAWDWGAAPTNGASICVAFYKGVDTVTPINDSGQQLTSELDLTGLSAGANDMMVGVVGSYGGITSVNDSSQTELWLTAYNSAWGGFAQKAAGTGMYWTPAGADSYSTCAAIIIKNG